MESPSRSLRSSGSRDPSGRIPVRSGAKALVTDSGRVLLIRERHAGGSTFWTLPGGGLAPGETAREGLRRELSEELNCRLAFDDEVGHFWYVHRSDDHTVTRYAVFVASAVSDVTPCPDEGILEAGWFQPSACPSTTLPQVQFLLDEEVGTTTSSGSALPAGETGSDVGRPGRTR